MSLVVNRDVTEITVGGVSQHRGERSLQLRYRQLLFSFPALLNLQSWVSFRERSTHSQLLGKHWGGNPLQRQALSLCGSIDINLWCKGAAPPSPMVSCCVGPPAQTVTDVWVCDEGGDRIGHKHSFPAQA